VSGICLAPLTARRSNYCPRRGEEIRSWNLDSGLEGEDYVSYVARSNYKGGELAAHLSKVLGGKGKVALLRYPRGPAACSSAEQDFLDLAIRRGIPALSSNACSSLHTEQGDLALAPRTFDDCSPASSPPL